MEYSSLDFNQYGAICDDLWDIRDARVVCRMLGFRDAEVAWKYSHFGASSSAIIYDDVACEGTEGSLTFCEKSERWENDCSRSEHAGVTCKRGRDFN